MSQMRDINNRDKIELGGIENIVTDKARQDDICDDFSTMFSAWIKNWREFQLLERLTKKP